MSATSSCAARDDWPPTKAATIVVTKKTFRFISLKSFLKISLTSFPLVVNRAKTDQNGVADKKQLRRRLLFESNPTGWHVKFYITATGMVQVYESLLCALIFCSGLRSSSRRRRRDKTAPARFSQRPESFHSRDNKIPHPGQRRFLTQSTGWATCTKSMACDELAPLARRLQDAFA